MKYTELREAIEKSKLSLEWFRFDREMCLIKTDGQQKKNTQIPANSNMWKHLLLWTAAVECVELSILKILKIYEFG